MKRLILSLLIVLGVSPCFASSELSQQATAFYSDNNFQKTLELILQINEHERTAQDWLILGNLLEEKDCELEFSGNKFFAEFKPFEIKTFKVILK